MLVSEDDSATEVNSNAREYKPRLPALTTATGGGVLARLNVATSCSARKDDARRRVLILVEGVVVMMIKVAEDHETGNLQKSTRCSKVF